MKRPVLIVGGGPVGLFLAIELGTQQVPCILVNAGPTTALHPAGNTHNTRTMEHYRRLGLARRVRELGLPYAHATDVAYRTRVLGTELARIDMPSSREKQANRTHANSKGPEPLHRASQMLVEAVLRHHASTLPSVDLRFGWKFLSFETGPDGITAHLENALSGTQDTVTARWLIGCDGARSTVRQTLGISLTGNTLEAGPFMAGRMRSTYARIPALIGHPDLPPTWQTWTVNGDARACFVSIDGKGAHAVLTPQGGDVPLEDIRKHILRAIGQPIDMQIISSKPWTAGRALVADQYGAGAVLLAGDAAHLFTPTGGFGMNTGIDDAANLAWKLSAVHQGWGSPQLLTTYEGERRPIGLRNTSASLQWARKVQQLSIPDALESPGTPGDEARTRVSETLNGFREEFASLGIQLGARYDDSPLVISDGSTPPQDNPHEYVPSACPGGRAPHLWLNPKTEESLFDHFGSGFTLLRLGKAPDSRAIEQCAASRSIPLKVVNIDQEQAQATFEKPLVLVRPDQIVGWRGGQEPQDVDAMWQQLTGFRDAHGNVHTDPPGSGS